MRNGMRDGSHIAAGEARFEASNILGASIVNLAQRTRMMISLQRTILTSSATSRTLSAHLNFVSMWAAPLKPEMAERDLQVKDELRRVSKKKGSRRPAALLLPLLAEEASLVTETSRFGLVVLTGSRPRRRAHVGLEYLAAANADGDREAAKAAFTLRRSTLRRHRHRPCRVAW